ncbi:hypothetical protein D3C72_2286240 [compost metagenome]
MGHLQGDALAFFRLPVFLEGRVVILVEVAHHVVGDIEQGGRSLGGACQGEASGKEGGGEQSFHRAFLLGSGSSRL